MKPATDTLSADTRRYLDHIERQARKGVVVEIRLHLCKGGVRLYRETHDLRPDDLPDEEGSVSY